VYNLLFSILNPQDEVIILAPYWVSYPEMIRMVYGVPVVVTPEDGRYQPRMADIERAVSPATRAIIVNSPNNPSGLMYSEDFVADIVRFCERKNIYLIMDDIYHKLVFDGKKAPSAYKYTTKDIESSKLVTINGISKLYGMTGFRIGWAVANRKLVEVMNNVQAQTTSCTSPILQAAAEGALTGLQSIVEGLRLMIENNRNVMMQELQSFTGVKVARPDGTFYFESGRGKLYFGNEDGDAFIMEAGRKAKVLSKVNVDAPICGTPIVANGVLYIPTQHSLLAIPGKPAAPRTAHIAEPVPPPAESR
jgi:aspartate aminotransferase